MSWRRFLWIAPALALLAMLSVYPLLYSLWMSLTTESGAFTLGNYARIPRDHLLLAAVLQTVAYIAIALSIELVLGLGLAVLIDGLKHGRALFRASFLAPMLLPPVVSAVIWRLIYNPQFGVLNATLRIFGIDTSHLTWTSGEGSALFSVIAVDVWEWTPFMFLLISAGLQAIPEEPLEAARIDGASDSRIFRDIILPLLKPTIFLAVLLRCMDLVRIFDQVWILTQGGPGFATETVSLYIYRTAFRFFNFGYAAAMSLIGLALAGLFARGLLRAMKVRVA